MNRTMQKLGYVFFLMAVMLGCNNVKKETVATYENREPKLVQYLKKEKGKEICTKEEMYYESGALRYVGSFENEKPNGVWEYFYDDGSLFAKATFKNGETNRAAWDLRTRSGKPLFDTKGDIQVVRMDASHCPVFVINSVNDTIFEAEFYPDFSLRFSGAMLNGKQHGKWSYWFENGSLQTEGFFIDGLLEGMQSVYYENGNLYYSGKYKNGKRIGKWDFLDVDGNIINGRDYGGE